MYALKAHTYAVQYVRCAIYVWLSGLHRYVQYRYPGRTAAPLQEPHTPVEDVRRPYLLLGPPPALFLVCG